MNVSLTEKTLHFKKPARTSRGSYSEHRMIVVRLTDGSRYGEGECAPLPDLSCDRGAYDDLAAVEALVRKALVGCGDEAGGLGNIADSDRQIEAELAARLPLVLRDYPALLFAMESAVAGMCRSPWLYDTPFARSEVGIPINGLVWMASYDEMLRQVEEKLKAGYRCIKLKIGAIDWEDEIKLIRLIRSRFSRDELQLRVDANGAFDEGNVIARLEELSKYGLHSIEQPVRAGQWELMARLCAETPLPIALDEELIGVNDPSLKREMLDTVKPQYIVVKPTLHGGMSGTVEWIGEARSRGIGSWITSALESNIGLKNVALLAAAIYDIRPENVSDVLAQGLGTGLLFTDNIDTGVHIEKGLIKLENGTV